ncbi:MAG: HAD family hydrolase [Verrucomicrobia bacterium]|nr:HAD family hydrolase [Verrucomicrobiota bacterium]
MNKAVFLDRDGVLIEERNYLKHPDEVVVFPRTPHALARLKRGGFKLIIVTNQSGVGRGYFTVEDVDAVHNHIISILEPYGAVPDKFYFAPEAPGTPSRGRKPSPQFLLDAAAEFELDLSSCFMVGDKLVDLETGWNAGVNRSILVRTGYGHELEESASQEIGSAVIVDDLEAAAEWILSVSSGS